MHLMKMEVKEHKIANVLANDVAVAARSGCSTDLHDAEELEEVPWARKEVGHGVPATLSLWDSVWGPFAAGSPLGRPPAHPLSMRILSEFCMYSTFPWNFSGAIPSPPRGRGSGKPENPFRKIENKNGKLYIFFLLPSEEKLPVMDK